MAVLSRVRKASASAKQYVERSARPADRTKGEPVSATEGVTSRAIGIAELLESEEAKGLLESAQTAGALNTDDIAVALDELELDAGVIDDFYQALDELQIEIVGRNATEDDESDLDAMREVSTDALQLFLKDIG